ncbi:NAD-dependent epimerase/dehydratase family protein, partial [bacterium]|nr:NAD-dependent epimerase/dehydratase family protein [bacterium]
MQHALVTGGTGFIGQHLVRKLVGSGIKTTALVRPSSDISPLLGLGEDVQIFEFDQSFESIKRCFNENSFDAVFHLATHFVADHDPKQIDELVKSNVTFGMKVAEAAASHKVENF